MKNFEKPKSLLNDKLKYYIDAIARFCDRCGTAYSPSDLRIIQDTGVSSIIHFSCSNCKSRHIATFLKPIGVSSRMPINTDLNIEEIGRFASKDEVSLNEVLDIYEKLKGQKKTQI